MALTRTRRHARRMSDCLGARRYRVRLWGEYGSQADRDEGRRQDGLTSLELEELSELRRENRQLREEREI